MAESNQPPRRDPAGARAQTAPAFDFDDHGAALRNKTDAELRAANFVLRTLQSPWMMRAGTTLARAGLALRVPGTAAILERTVFRQFCGGTSLDEALATARRLHGHGVRTILDYAVEGGKEEAEFDEARRQLERALEHAASGPEVAFCATKVSGMARDELLAKASAGQPLSDGERAELDRVCARLEAVAGRAAELGEALFIDAEYTWIQPAIDDLTEQLMRAHNRQRAMVHTTVQLYLRDRLDYLRALLDDARAHNYLLGVKLVRGAYLEIENERAAERGASSPVQPSKEATDAAFDQALTLCLENLDRVVVCVATHNINSTHHLIAEMERLGIERGDPRVTVAQLLGMFDRVTFPLAAHGYNALKYVPYGPIRSAFPYLLRRADENRSIADQSAGELDAVRSELRRRGRRPL